MTKSNSKTSSAPNGAFLLESPALTKALDKILCDAKLEMVTETALVDMLHTDAMQLGGISRQTAVLEGRLIEKAVVAIAKSNPDIFVVAETVRLPLAPAALELVEKNRASLIQGLTIDAYVRSKKTYTPDLLFVRSDERTAYVVEIKKSLSGYLEGSRLADLQAKMLAAAMVVRDYLWKEQKSIAVDNVLIAIVDASAAASAHDYGIWALADLDELIGVPGAGVMVATIQTRFRDYVQAVWRAAVDQIVNAERTEPSTVRTEQSASAKIIQDENRLNHERLSEIAPDDQKKRGRPKKPKIEPVRIGLAKPLSQAMH